MDGYVLMHEGNFRRRAQGHLKKHPRDRLVFGTDYPIMDPQDEIDALQRRTHFSDNEIDEILANGTRLLFG